jgi:hypothetical protein
MDSECLYEHLLKGYIALVVEVPARSSEDWRGIRLVVVERDCGGIEKVDLLRRLLNAAKYSVLELERRVSVEERCL